MPPLSNPDDALLLIRCPSCGQRFKVGDDLRARTVECGACEHRFRINDEVIVRGQKFYPGERKDPKLNQFQRVPLAMSAEVSGIVATRYGEAPDPTEFEPVAPERIIAGVVGVIGMALMALLLMFGATRGGSLDGMTTDNRLLMAGFTGLLGVALLVYANPRARLKSAVVGLLMSAGLLALPLVFTDGSVTLADLALASAPPAERIEAETDRSDEPLEELRKVIGTAPLEAEIARLERDGSPRRAVGLWLRGMREQNRLLVRDYILRVTDADPQTHYYSRGNGEFLMVITGVRQSLDEVARHAEALGSVEQVYPELSVAEIRINNANFVAGPIEDLNNIDHPDFYGLNKKELASIDLERVERAVQRLADVPPKVYRSDITRILMALLTTEEVDFKGDICRALEVWPEQQGPAGEAALKEVQGMLKRKAKVPKEMIQLIVKEKTPGGVAILDELWEANATQWESLYGDLGAPAEATLIARLAGSQGMVRHSVVRLLGRVGGTDSLPVLAATAAAGVEPELDVLIANSIAAIRKRIKAP